MSPRIGREVRRSPRALLSRNGLKRSFVLANCGRTPRRDAERYTYSSSPPPITALRKRRGLPQSSLPHGASMDLNGVTEVEMDVV